MNLQDDREQSLICLQMGVFPSTVISIPPSTPILYHSSCWAPHPLIQRG